MTAVLYVAGENIPAGHYVIHRDPASEYVYGYDSLASAVKKQSIFIAVGIARENLREGFRVSVQDQNVFEDDA